MLCSSSGNCTDFPNLAALITVTRRRAPATPATATWKLYITAIVLFGAQEAVVGHGLWRTSVRLLKPLKLILVILIIGNRKRSVQWSQPEEQRRRSITLLPICYNGSEG
jgi:hypothetical protein